MFEGAGGCCENAEEFHVRYREGYELRVPWQSAAQAAAYGRRMETMRAALQSIIEQRPFEQGRLAVASAGSFPSEDFRANTGTYCEALQSQRQLEILRWSLPSMDRPFGLFPV